MNYDVICITGMPRAGTTFLIKSFSILKEWKIKNNEGNIISLILDEPEIIGKYFNSGNVPNSIFQNIYDKQKKINTGIISYKHPQAIFVNPIIDKLKVKYIYCIRRNYNEWKKSAIKIGIESIIGINCKSNWIKNNWPNDWNFPKNIDDRIKIFYELYKNKINKELEKKDSILFEFEDSKKSINMVFKFLGFDINKCNKIHSILWYKHDEYTKK